MKRVFDDRRANIVGHLSIDKLAACLQSYGAQDLSQSREYIKKISETETEKRMAYEISVSKIEFLE